MGMDSRLMINRWVNGNEVVVADLGIPAEQARLQIVVFHWYRAQAIHAWFVEKPEGGSGGMGWYEVTFEVDQLLDFWEEVVRALKDDSTFWSLAADDPYREVFKDIANAMPSLVEKITKDDSWSYTCTYQADW